MPTDPDLELDRLWAELRALEAQIARLEAIQGSGGQNQDAYWEDNP